MATFCPVGQEVFDNDTPMCPVHFQPTRPVPPEGLPGPEPVPRPDPVAAPLVTVIEAPVGLRIRFAGLEESLRAGPGLLIGRGPHSPFGSRLEGIGWTNVGRQHCILRFSDAGQVEVLDLDSRNGTFIDGVRVAANVPQLLSPGATLRLAANREVELTWS